ncbi:hypothetical protein GMOD_00010287 [Pyrenophora seminiperda CCB06]|uniref:Uncharacterized protein n=1 Tax=Pyrenophora seminiperda CCB06 TaxID=1302712 RepID=A0A3M7M5E4_9PLEO|nr:hypothetical protein GMOD_00010287 [Pyrenophora seminiperda CCB06]
MEKVTQEQGDLPALQGRKGGGKVSVSMHQHRKMAWLYGFLFFQRAREKAEERRIEEM